VELVAASPESNSCSALDSVPLTRQRVIKITIEAQSPSRGMRVLDDLEHDIAHRLNKDGFSARSRILWARSYLRKLDPSVTDKARMDGPRTQQAI